MSLIKAKTKWALFLSSSTAPEERHILDLAFGLKCLESAGIAPTDIVIYIDGPDRILISQLISSASTHTYSIKTSSDFFVDQNNNDYENLTLFITGHGSISGIDAPTPITPYALLRGIKESPNLKCAVVYLGQCHAGIFNYIGAGKKTKANGDSEPEVIFIGATNLHASLSSSTQEVFLNGPMSWPANLFLLHIFKWISAPMDVDGDGRCTVIDSYKYTGAMSNSANRDIKVGSFVRSIDLHQKYVVAKTAHSSAPTPANQLALRAIETQYANELEIRYTHQECWILNAIPAQNIEI